MIYICFWLHTTDYSYRTCNKWTQSHGRQHDELLPSLFPIYREKHLRILWIETNLMARTFNIRGFKNSTQSVRFNCLFFTLYGCYGILSYWNWKTHVLSFFCYLTFDILTTGHEMAIISVTLVCKTISEISFVSLCYVPYFEGLLSN